MNWKAVLVLSLLFLTGAYTTTVLISGAAPQPRLQDINTQLADDTLPPLQGEPIDGPGGPH